MKNLKLYNSIFNEIFNIDVELLSNNFNSNTVEKWDSVCQLSLVTHIEDEFDVMLEPEDIIGFNSYDVGKNILRKYNVEIK